VSVLFGNGDGTFRQPLIYGTGFGTVGVVAGDLNGDGKPDVVVGNESRNSSGFGSVSVLLNRGQLTIPNRPVSPCMLLAPSCQRRSATCCGCRSLRVHH